MISRHAFCRTTWAIADGARTSLAYWSKSAVVVAIESSVAIDLASQREDKDLLEDQSWEYSLPLCRTANNLMYLTLSALDSAFSVCYTVLRSASPLPNEMLTEIDQFADRVRGNTSVNVSKLRGIYGIFRQIEITDKTPVATRQIQWQAF